MKTALGDDASPTGVSTDARQPTDPARPVAGGTETSRTQPARDSLRGEAPIDRSTLAALIAAAESDAATPDAAASIEALLAKLGLTRDANGNVVAADGETDELAGTTETSDDTATSSTGGAELAAALAALAQLLGQTPSQAQTPTTTTPSTDAAALAAAGVGMAAGDPMAAPTDDLGGTLMPSEGEGEGESEGEGATTPAPDPAQTAAAGGEAALRASGRGANAASRAEERFRRITAEVAQLDMSASSGDMATIEVKGVVTPVANVAEAAGKTSATAQLATLGDVLAETDASDVAVDMPAKPAPQAGEATTAFVLPTSQAADAAPTTATAPTTAAPASTPASQTTLDGLAQTVAAHAARQETRFEIKLNPGELGKVDISMQIGADGTVTAHMRVERADTLDMMLRDQSQLQRALEQSGLNVGSGGLEFSLQQQGQGYEREAAERYGDEASDAAEDDSPVVEAMTAARRYSRAGPAGVDLRV